MAVTTLTLLELGFAARSATGFERLAGLPVLPAMPLECLTPVLHMDKHFDLVAAATGQTVERLRVRAG